MSFVSELSQCPDYLSYRSCVPLRKISVDFDGNKGWSVYDSGPKSVKNPLICLPPVSGTADIYFKQALQLSAKGFRIISAEPPVYWTIQEFCDGFKRLLDYLELQKVHIFGASLGGFLAQKFAECTSLCPRVASLILCNSFTDTKIFSHKDSALLFWLLPNMVLKRMILSNFHSEKVDPDIIDAIDFMVERLESLSQSELASRLTLNCIPDYVEVHKLSTTPITIIDVFDEYALSSNVRDEMSKCYPHAKLAHLKTGGNFPYLSRADEVNIFLQIHLRQFSGTNEDAADSRTTL